ncbi:small ribosomal subunit Rsm22 family protein [Kribbella sp. NPDC048915]|uniref:small ribosomal subunit Rsm22 family protein n=1 Tax=Kribbella sp. NPDC048915 TaxID=3155148 RepID=UPI0033DF325C
MSSADNHLHAAHLHAALARAAAGIPHQDLRRRVTALSHRYRTEQVADATPGLTDRLDALAYAVVRMPATFRALYAALAQAQPHLDPPVTHLDLGGGTGAAAWAVAALWPSTCTEIIERQPAAIALGRQLASSDPALGSGVSAGWRWTRADLRNWQAPDGEVGLVTIGYVLNELAPGDRDELVQKAAAVATTIAVVEPGSPGGHRRILAARETLLGQGFAIAAPCPHHGPCPVDWCHFGARLPRTELHRTLKDGTRNFEDEKFSYVVATRSAVHTAGQRVLTRPTHRKGQVVLDLCTESGAAERIVVPRSSPSYRPAKAAIWGDEFTLWRPERSDRQRH